jgi:hypothetical protein
MNHKIKVQITNEFGHSELLMSPAETAEAIQERPDGHWVYIDSTLVHDADAVDTCQLESASGVQIFPGVVGG